MKLEEARLEVQARDGDSGGGRLECVHMEGVHVCGPVALSVRVGVHTCMALLCVRGLCLCAGLPLWGVWICVAVGVGVMGMYVYRCESWWVGMEICVSVGVYVVQCVCRYVGNLCVSVVMGLGVSVAVCECGYGFEGVCCCVCV